ncbi:hypothetical protein [Paenibacillus dendritiformis]|uniref:hypothetical protein n=1 Tax=Paenibacillus dendritiformis TaxID=130049 RepID=UPI000DA75B4E|nr:hypothetical protein [Paenibacillus dendritiformis]PZM62613.1 hypothetical protein DOE73_26510 [Paenibacillus dendritiformis]
MKIRLKIKEDKKQFRKHKQQAEKLSRSRAEVGWIGDREQVLKAIFNEYGANIPVTDKMRKKLLTMGVHLRDDTHFITLPERPFLRAGYDAYEGALSRLMQSLVGQALAGTITPERALERAAKELKKHIQSHIEKGSFVPNSKLTEKLKGGNHPLIDEKTLMDTLEYEVHMK